MQEVVRFIEGSFAPRLVSVDGQAPTGTIDVPAGTTSVALTYALGPEQPSPTTAQTLSSPGVTRNGTAAPGNFAGSTFTLPLPSLQMQGSDRRAAVSPYAIGSTARDSLGLGANTTVETSAFSLRTTNLPPVAVDDSFGPTGSALDAGPVVLNVLTQGRDRTMTAPTARLT